MKFISLADTISSQTMSPSSSLIKVVVLLRMYECMKEPNKY